MLCQHRTSVYIVFKYVLSCKLQFRVSAGTDSVTFYWHKVASVEQPGGRNDLS